MSDNVGRTVRKTKRLRAHVDYDGMSVSYGRVKLGVPSGFKEMLEAVTKEILREQPKNIPGFLAVYFSQLSENQKTGSVLATLVTERIVEVNPEPTTVEMEVQVDEERPETSVAGEQTDTIEETTTEQQTEPTTPEKNVVPESTGDVENSRDAVEIPESSVKRQCSDTALMTKAAPCSKTMTSNSVPLCTKDQDASDICADKSHTSICSVSQLPGNIKMVNCDLILKKSAEDLACELEDTENVETESRAASAQEKQNSATRQDNQTEEEVTQEVQVMSLEQQDANHYEYLDGSDDDEPEESPQKQQQMTDHTAAPAEPEHYCPDEEEPVEDITGLRPSTTYVEGGELSLEQQASIEYEEDEPAPEEPVAEEPAVEEPAPEEQAPEEPTPQEPAPEEPVEQATEEPEKMDTVETPEETKPEAEAAPEASETAQEKEAAPEPSSEQAEVEPIEETAPVEKTAQEEPASEETALTEAGGHRLLRGAMQRRQTKLN